MSYSLIDDTVRLDRYKPPEVKISCARCRREATVKVDQLRQKYGDIPIAEAARRTAATGNKPCGLAVDGGKQCSVRAFEPPVWHWANLYDALHGRWVAMLICHRHRGELKRSSPCPGDMVLDVATLAATLGHEFKLARLPGKFECPACHTNLVEIIWRVPDKKPPPHAPNATAPVLRLRPSRPAIVQRTLRAIIGGKS